MNRETKIYPVKKVLNNCKYSTTNIEIKIINCPHLLKYIMSMRLNKNYKKSIKKGFFITGTDTNVGKTLVAASISRTLISQGFSTVAIKPAASGCFIKDNKLYSHDALTLQKYSSNKTLSYSSINPFAFKEPIAPHVAAKKNNINLSVSQILSKSQEALTCN